VIAGTPPAERVERLDALWHAISWPDIAAPFAFTPLQILHNTVSNAVALTAGQPGFFTPRPVNPYLVPQAAPEAVSFYDTSPMLGTLQRFADFGLINSRRVRLSLGATNIATGNLEFFDNHHTLIRPEHALASGSLPPGFPATRVGDQYYWDGGCVSNTPLDAIIDEPDHPTAGGVHDRPVGRRGQAANQHERGALAGEADPVREPDGAPRRRGGVEDQPAPRGAAAEGRRGAGGRGRAGRPGVDGAPGRHHPHHLPAGGGPDPGQRRRVLAHLDR
jgi:predicted acylesterase/phospholipase RssA